MKRNNNLQRSFLQQVLIKEFAIIILLILVQLIAKDTNACYKKMLFGSYEINGNYSFPVKGKITDVDGNPIPSVSITEKGTTNSTTTAEDGTFKITVSSENAILIISSIGFEILELLASNVSESPIVLSVAETSMDEVVVVGYGTQKRSDVTGSVASVPKERLQQLPNSNVFQAIQGSVPGVFVSTTSAGAEGNGMSVLIRGRKSITANTAPLIILDGIPYTGSISDINPNDIESIEVLKDASAVAIYGSRGSNGVFIVTSKQGKRGISITYDGFYSTQTLTNKPELLTGPEFYEFKQNRKNANNFITAQEQEVYDSGEWVDWYELATRTGTRNQHSLSVSGGGEKFNFYFGGTYLDVKGVTKNDDFKRYSLKPSLSMKITRWLTINSVSQLSFNDRSGLPVQFDDESNTGSGANFFNPLTQPYDSNGSIAIYAYTDNQGAGNPLSNLFEENTSRLCLGVK